MNFFTLFRLFGRSSIESAIAHNLGKIGPDGWTALGADFSAAVEACKSESKVDLAAALTSVLFEIK